MSDAILQIRDLTVRVGDHGGAPSILDNVSLSMMPGETLGLVGESGSGKSTLGQAVLGLNSPNLLAGTTGEILWRGRDLKKMTRPEVRRIRGREISMILQDPMTSLNPVKSIGMQIKEALKRIGSRELDAEAKEALAQVHIPSPEQRLKSYPHQLSGGMSQRVIAAMMLAQKPSLLICDEPTTALDATIQYQFLELLKSLRKSHGMAMLFITHDFGVVARICDRVAVMYSGQIVESGPVREILARPAHPYTKALLASVPSTDHTTHRLPVIEGLPPTIGQRPEGCPFHPRCPQAAPVCMDMPEESRITTNHLVRCAQIEGAMS